MIVAVDRQKLTLLLNENCSASIICVSFSSSSTTQDSFKMLLRYGQRQFGKKNNEKATIKSHKRASQTTGLPSSFCMVGCAFVITVLVYQISKTKTEV